MDPIEKVENVEQAMKLLAEEIHRLVSRYQDETSAQVKTVHVEWDEDEIAGIAVDF